ncbi:hypothetical protein ABNQ39_06920 [Azospirillum sp. A26]|uniref:hypothetical protein n=1 Tax=Azospirillum sp. A26 TaxID=3160607 RepID=UPI00366D85BC
MRLLVVLFAFILSATPALADWQYTKWGMSPDAVFSASGGKAIKLDQKGIKDHSIASLQLAGLYLAEYQTGPYRFTCTFLFRDEKLGGISLNLSDISKSYQLEDDLMGKYGQPIEVNQKYKIKKWRDEASNNLVQISITPGLFTSVLYLPISQPHSSGL